MTSRDSVRHLARPGGELRKSPRVKPTHGAPTKTLLARQFVIWSAHIYIYFIARVN